MFKLIFYFIFFITIVITAFINNSDTISSAKSYHDHSIEITNLQLKSNYKDRFYNVNSSYAAKTKENIYLLKDIQASSQDFLKLEALYGSFDSLKKVINLRDKTKLEFLDYFLTADDAVLNLINNTGSLSGKIKLKNSHTELTSNQCDIKNKKIYCTGDVMAKINLSL